MAFAFLSSARLLQWLCIVLHFTLVALHISLLIVLARRAEHTVVVSLAKSGMASTILVVVLQVFITGYSVVLLVSTQRLALKRVLLKRQTLTAAHDVSSAWTGLGAALVSLWRQTSISASLFGTSLVAMYLAGTAVLHITTLSLFVIEAFNNTNAVIIPSTIGRHNITLNSSVSDTSYAFFFWESTSELLPYVGHASPQATLGLYNSTLFDVLENNNSLGNVSVGASAANISCGFLSNGTAVNTNATDPSSVWFLRADYDGYEIGFDVPPIDAGVIKVVPQNLLLLQTKYLGRNVIFYLTANISDSEGNLGGLIPLDPPLKPVYAGEGYAVGTVRVVGCTLSWMPQNATVDAQTRNLVSANPSGLRTSSTWNIWTPTLQNSSLLVPYVEDPHIDAWGDMFQWTESDGSVDDGPNTSEATDLEECIMENLGIFPGDNPPFYNIISIRESNLTASMYWAAGNIATDTFIREQNVADRTYDVALLPGEAMGALIESRLNLNLTPPQVIIGLVTSVSLLVLATVMSHGIGDRNTPVDSLGILELIWLIRDQPALQDAVGQVNNSTPEDLRAAGMFEMSVAGEIIASAHGASYRNVKLDGEE